MERGLLPDLALREDGGAGFDFPIPGSGSEILLAVWVSGDVGEWRVSVRGSPGGAFGITHGRGAFLYTARDFDGNHSVGVLSEGGVGAVAGGPLEKSLDVGGRLISTFWTEASVRMAVDTPLARGPVHAFSETSPAARTVSVTRAWEAPSCSAAWTSTPPGEPSLLGDDIVGQGREGART